VTEEIPSNLIREAKKNDVKQIVKLSVFQSVGTIGKRLLNVTIILK